MRLEYGLLLSAPAFVFALPGKREEYSPPANNDPATRILFEGPTKPSGDLNNWFVKANYNNAGSSGPNSGVLLVYSCGPPVKAEKIGPPDKKACEHLLGKKDSTEKKIDKLKDKCKGSILQPFEKGHISMCAAEEAIKGRADVAVGVAVSDQKNMEDKDHIWSDVCGVVMDLCKTTWPRSAAFVIDDTDVPKSINLDTDERSLGYLQLYTTSIEGFFDELSEEMGPKDKTHL